jgi:accessory gene regulator B
MMRQFAKAITSFLIQENIIPKDEVEIYRYGTEQILINLMTFVVIGILATITGTWIETIFFFAGLIPIRMIAGGYHSKTSQRCNVLTFFVYAVNMILISLMKSHITHPLMYTINMILLVTIFRFAPVDHKNRVLNGLELSKAKKSSRITGVVIVGFCIVSSVMFGLSNIISISTMMGAFTASVSLFIGSIVRGGEKNEKSKFFA